MYSIWSILNSSFLDEKTVWERLDKCRDIFGKPLNGSYFKPFQADKTYEENTKLKKNENELMKKIAPYLNLDAQKCAEVYITYLQSPFNQFIVSSDLLEKLHVDELFSAHFQRFVEYYYRERYCFLKNVTFLISIINDNSPYNNDEFKSQYRYWDEIRRIFDENDLTSMYESAIKDYEFLCKELKLFSSKKQFEFANYENFQIKTLLQLLKELEFTLEIILILANLIKIDNARFDEIVKLFNTYSIVKYLNSSTSQYVAQSQSYIDQITTLQVLIIVKMIRLDRVTGFHVMDDLPNEMSSDDKTRLMNVENKNQMNDLITSFGSNYKASPIMLAWSTLLYNLSKPEPNKTLGSLISRMFSISQKENVFAYLLSILATDVFQNTEVVWHVKQIIYELLNAMLNTFEEKSIGENFKLLYELCFFCMDKQELICRHFWKLCQQPDRENLTILLFYSLETFPISFAPTLTFFTLLSKSSADLCKQVTDYVSHMDQYCEYFDNINSEEFTIGGDCIRLITNRRLFDGCILKAGTKGSLIGSQSSTNFNIAHKMILTQPAISWTVNFSLLDLIRCYLIRINNMVSQNIPCDTNDENNMITIVQFIDSLLKYFYEMPSNDYIYQKLNGYMDIFVDFCCYLFTSLMNQESNSSSGLLSKLFELFNNISSKIPQKLIDLLEQNRLIGHENVYDKMDIQQIFNNRFNLVNSSSKQLYLLKSQNYELIINYFKLIDNVIQNNGNSIRYLSPLCCMLVLIFPQIHKWKNNTFSLNLEFSLTCLNLLHSVLNSSSSDFMLNLIDPTVGSNLQIDQICETILLNTECSNSLLYLIYNTYECCQDSNFLYEIKKLDNILLKNVSLINRLIVAPTPTETFKNDQLEKKYESITQSLMYSLMVKSINQQTQSNLVSITNNSSGVDVASGSSSSASKDDTINKNNQFLLQLNLMMSQANNNTGGVGGAGSSINRTFSSLLNTADLTTNISDTKNGINWFHLLIQIAKHKSNQSLDCLLFSLFKKISQLTPRLFGSLLGPYAGQMHSIVLSKLKFECGGQIISTVCEFLCSLIENQPGFFQTLVNMKVEIVTDQETKKSTEKFIENDTSLLKILFQFLNELKKNKDSQDYHSSMSGLYSVFYTMWINKKIDYMNYCRQKDEFWTTMAAVLRIKKKSTNNKLKNELDNHDPYSYLGLFEFDTKIYEIEQNQDTYENQDIVIDELILESNIKCVSYTFKILSLELYESIYLKKGALSSKQLEKILNEEVYAKNLLENWLEFYKYQLEKDLDDERMSILYKLDQLNMNNVQPVMNANVLILDSGVLSDAKSSTIDGTIEIKKRLKSKMLIDSIKMFLLLINKTSRLLAGFNYSTSTTKQTTGTMLKDLLDMKHINLESVFGSFNDSILFIIEHLLNLNNILLSRQKELQFMREDSLMGMDLTNNTLVRNQYLKLNGGRIRDASEVINGTDSNFITLKQSNEILKQFNSLANTIMILVTSLSHQTEEKYHKMLINELTGILNKLILDDFNYFPAVINTIQTSILHLVTSNSFAFTELLKKDEEILKKFISIQCKIFSTTVVNLEDEMFVKSSAFKDCVKTFILNVNLIKFIMNEFDDLYWYEEILQRCVIQCLYSLFEKFIQNEQNSELMHSIMELFFVFAKSKIDHLAKSDFNARTCLLASKLFEFSSIQMANESPRKKIKLDLDRNYTPIKWSHVLRIYINIQTLLITQLKYKYLKETLLFFGSYFETIIQIIFSAGPAANNDSLETTKTFMRYLNQISLYKNELLINISNSMENLKRIFCSLIQHSIFQLSTVKTTILKMQQQQQMLSQQQKTQLGQQSNLPASNVINKFNMEELITTQNLLFTIISLCLDSLLNYIPNFGEASYMSKIDEYSLLISLQLSAPSSFDQHNILSFGSILWLIDYILKLLHRYETIPSSNSIAAGISQSGKSTAATLTSTSSNRRLQDILNEPSTTQSTSSSDSSPKKNVVITFDESNLQMKLPTKTLMVSVLEKTLNFLLTQIILCDRQSHLSPRDKKIFKRELSSEINTIIHGLNRTFKRTNSTQYGSKSPTAGSSSTQSISNMTSTNLQVASSSLLNSSSKQTHDFFKCIEHVLQHNVIVN